jgi:hypothetical protein
MNRSARWIALVALAALGALAGVAGCEERGRQWSMTKVEPSSSASASASGSSVSSTAPSTSSTGAVPQLHYGNVTLSGTLAEQTFPGAPGYGTDPAHDAKDVVLVLQLFAPVDLMRTDGDDDWNEDRMGVRKVSLVATKDATIDLHKLVGKAIKVKGKIYGAHSPKDHTDVLMSDVEIVPE